MNNPTACAANAKPFCIFARVGSESPRKFIVDAKDVRDARRRFMAAHGWMNIVGVVAASKAELERDKFLRRYA